MAMLAVFPPLVFRIRRSSNRGLRGKHLVCGLDQLSRLQCSGSPSVLFNHAPSTLGHPKPGKVGVPAVTLTKSRECAFQGTLRLTVGSRSFCPQSIFALYQREALLRDSRSLREDSRSLCARERSVVRPAFGEFGSKNRLSQASQR